MNNWKDYRDTLGKYLVSALADGGMYLYREKRKDAKALRHRLYRYRLAVRDAAMRGDEKAKDHYRVIRQVKLILEPSEGQIKKTGWLVMILPKADEVIYHVKA